MAATLLILSIFLFAFGLVFELTVPKFGQCVYPG